MPPRRKRALADAFDKRSAQEQKLKLAVQLKTYYAPQELAGYSEASECKPTYQPCHNGNLLALPSIGVLCACAVTR